MRLCEAQSHRAPDSVLHIIIAAFCGVTKQLPLGVLFRDQDGQGLPRPQILCNPLHEEHQFLVIFPLVIQNVLHTPICRLHAWKSKPINHLRTASGKGACHRHAGCRRGGTKRHCRCGLTKEPSHLCMGDRGCLRFASASRLRVRSSARKGKEREDLMMASEDVADKKRLSLVERYGRE